MPDYNGTNGHDTFVGTEGADTFRPLLGLDTVNGLGGSDTLFVDYATAPYDPYTGASVPFEHVVTVTSSGGSFAGTISAIGTSRTIFSNIEHLRVKLSAWHDRFVLDGSALTLGASADLDGSGGFDTLEADFSALGPLNAQFGPGLVTTTGFGTISGFEAFRLQLGSGADLVTAGAWNDFLAGGGGADTLDGGAGDDVLYGGTRIASHFEAIYGPNTNGPVTLDTGSDADTLRGGSGYDLLFAGFGDTADGGADGAGLLISLQASSVGLTVDFRALANGGTLTIGGGVISNITDVRWIEGTQFDDDLIGSDVRQWYTYNTPIFGRGGHDRLIAGAASGNIYGGDGNDAISSIYATGAYHGEGGDDVITATHAQSRSFGGEGNDTLNVAGEAHGGAGNDIINMSDIFPYLAVGYGDEGDDRLNGSATTSTLAGGAGADIVYGYDGNDLLFSAGPAEGLNPNAPVVGPIAGEADSGTERDQLFGGAGDDRLSIGYGDDADGGAGTNSLALSLRGAASGVTFATPDIASGAAFSLGGGTIQNVQSIVVLWGSSFADTLTLGAQSSGVTVFGEGGNDTINTPGAADTIRGGAGADIIDAGGGDDTIHYDAADEAASGEQVDGGSGVDTVQTAAQIVVDLTGATFTRIERLVALGGAIISTTTLNGIGSLGGSFTLANGGAVSIGSGTAIGNLFFTLSAAGNQIDLGGVDLPYGLIRVYGKGGEDIITASPAIGGDYHGGGGNDVLIGGSSSDHLYGNEGNDRLDGRGSGDWMTGGTGDDLYIFDNFNDRAVENDGEGNDTIESSVTIWEGYAVNVETLKLTGTAAIGATGDHRANTLIGNVAGNMLDGGGGADTMIGGLGNDIYYVDEPSDSVQENPGEGTDEIRTDLGSYSLATLANVENLTGASEFGQTLTGNSGANRILGSQGADTLNGSAGDDFLEGRGAGDALVGGTGDDIYSFVDAEDVATEQADEGIDEIRTTLGTYVLAANFEKLTAVGAGARDFRGNMAGNVVTGGSGNDTLRLHDGGGDGTSGLAGNDIFFFGGALDNWDRIDGGAGTDTLVLQGNYAGFIMAPEVLAGIEGISLQGGSVTRWGQAGTSSYDYGLTLANAATAPGVQLRINGQSLQSGEDFAFDGSAESDGRFLLYAGFGIDTFTGGSGNDVFFFEAGRFGAGDRIVGGGGSDAVVISGAPDGVAGPAQVAIAAGALNGVESLSFNGRFASDPAARPSYSAVMQDGNLGGGTLIVNASSLAIGQSLSFDGSAVADGRLRIFGGADGDTLRGGAGDDVIEGGGLGDAITGGGGMDVFVYRNVSDSAGAARDVIHGFHFGNDKIDLSLIDANANADGNQAFAWIGTEAFSGAAGQLRAGFDSDMNMWAVQGDVDGDGNADFQLYVATGAGPPPEADFVF